MNKQFLSFCEELTNQIKSTYTEGTTLDEAEKLAAKFLHAQLMVSEQLSKADLDARMKRTGVKAVKAAVYMAEATKSEKKPTEAMLSALIDSNELVAEEQNAYDEAEVLKNSLENYFLIFKEAHIYYRGISKGRFE